MIAAGIDIGGTKIETQIFDADWQMVARHRVPTPGPYPELLSAITSELAWAETQAGRPLPVGLSLAGLVNPTTGLALTANLSASGRPLPVDLAAASGRQPTVLNDCRALALSEAVLGAGRGARTVVGLIVGTGIGGGVTRDGRLLGGPSATGGEFGHIPAAAPLVCDHGLPIAACGCGRRGCIETLASGRGIARLSEALTGQARTAPEIAAARATEPAAAKVWQVWTALMAELLQAITLSIDPDVIVLGGGLSKVDGVADDLAAALAATQFAGFACPRIVTATGGDASGARGAALAALQETTLDRPPFIQSA